MELFAIQVRTKPELEDELAQLNLVQRDWSLASKNGHDAYVSSLSGELHAKLIWLTAAYPLHEFRVMEFVPVWRA
jgi:hypothetical protein